MHQLHFKAEVRTIKELGIEAAAVSEAELKLANQLIDHLAAKRFDPNEFSDEHRARVEAAIRQKVEGKEVTLAESPVKNSGGNVVDLMEALKASLNARGTEKTAEVKDRKTPKRARPPQAIAAAKKSARR
jgi:DNA end-binding protein Ku